MAVRIHVERKMEQIKNFRILQGTIPATEWNNANNVALICTALAKGRFIIYGNDRVG